MRSRQQYKSGRQYRAGALASVFIAFALLAIISIPNMTVDKAFAEDMPGIPIELFDGDVVEVQGSSDVDGEALPSMYISDCITSVKNQGSLGTCWAFSTAGALEANAKKKGIMSPDGSDPDFSELAMSYYSYNSTDAMIFGGISYYAGTQLMKWVGPVWENGLYNGFPYAYSTGTSASFSDNDATERDAIHLRDMNLVNSSDIPHVKAQIREQGAGSLALYWDTSNFSASPDVDGRYAYNATGSENSGHAVLVVGWDDNYSASNFNPSCAPSTNGAWLVKNSWGDSVSSKPYFWVSYEATSRRAFNVVFYNVDQVLAEDDIQQIGKGNVGALPVEIATTQSAGNIFTASDDGTLDAVSFYSFKGAVSYFIDVYTGIPSGGNPDDGTHIDSLGSSHTQTGSKEYPGYCTVDLTSSIPINKGEQYSIIVTLADSSGSQFASFEYQNNNTNSYLQSQTAGQSFLGNINGTWTDQANMGRAASIRAYYDRDVTTIEYAGETRYDTAAQAVLDAYPNGTNGVIIASGTNYPDAISASGLAGLLDYPLLITDPTALSQECAAAINTLKDGKTSFTVLIAGGTSAVSSTVETSLKSLCSSSSVIRLAGDSRYQTNTALFNYGSAHGSWPTTAIVCTGENYPDALSISAYAFAQKAPIFLVGGNGSIDSGVLSALQSNNFAHVIIVGGETVIPESIKGAIGSDLSYQRLAGATRYDTSLAVANYAVSQGTLDWKETGFATSENFPDSLVAGPIQGKAGGVLTLVNPSETGNNDAITSALKGKDFDTVRWYGGSGSIPPFARIPISDITG